VKFYVGTKWEEAPRARDIMWDLVGRGHEITHDWTECPQETPGAAYDDIKGVVDADVLVLVCEKDLPYANMLVELGAALGNGKPVYVLGKAPVTKLLMFQHPLIQFIGGLDEIS
jgi:hypothetical protein